MLRVGPEGRRTSCWEGTSSQAADADAPSRLRVRVRGACVRAPIRSSARGRPWCWKRCKQGFVGRSACRPACLPLRASLLAFRALRLLRGLPWPSPSPPPRLHLSRPSGCVSLARRPSPRPSQHHLAPPLFHSALVSPTSPDYSLTTITALPHAVVVGSSRLCLRLSGIRTAQASQGQAGTEPADDPALALAGHGPRQSGAAVDRRPARRHHALADDRVQPRPSLSADAAAQPEARRR
jgi:hypothetical protein